MVVTQIFLNQLIRFYSNKATNLCHFAYAVLPHNTEIVLRPQITVTSRHLCTGSVFNLKHVNALQTVLTLQ